MGRRVWMWTSAPPRTPVPSVASTLMVASTVCVSMALCHVPTTPPAANQHLVSPLPLFYYVLGYPFSKSRVDSTECHIKMTLLVKMFTVVEFLFQSLLYYKSVAYISDEEPFLIFANRYYLRKLNLDGSNYTLIKQVRWLSA